MANLTFFVEDDMKPTNVDIRNFVSLYRQYRMDFRDESTTLTDSPDVLMYNDGTPIAMVNIHILLSHLRNVYGDLDITSMMDRNPVMSVRELIEDLTLEDTQTYLNVDILISTLTTIYGHAKTSELLAENPSFSLSDLITILYRYGAR